MLALLYVDIIKQTQNGLQLIVLYRWWAITVTYRDKSDHQNGLPVHRLSEFYPYTKLKSKEINCDRDTWLKDPMSRPHMDTVKQTGSRHFHKTTRA